MAASTPHKLCTSSATFRSLRVPLLGALLLAPAVLPAQSESPVAVNPDVTVISLGSVSNWGSSGGIRAYSVGTTSCNIGTDPVAWCDAASCLGGTLQRNDHPVIAQGLYRLKNNRLEQLGMSWLKHGWLSTNLSNGSCGPGTCTIPPGGGDQLGVGCTDTYNSGLNGGTGNPGTCDSGSCRLGQRSAVNPSTGDFPMPYANVAHPGAIDQRLQVHEADVDSILNPGAVFFVEGQYIAADDGTADRAFNNASYREVTIGSAPNYDLTLSGSTVREKTALEAWLAADANVEWLDLDIPGSSPTERFQIARRVSQVDIDTWHYEYAVRNMNSDRAAQALTVIFPNGTPIANVGFHDVDNHSGELYSNADWVSTVTPATGTVSWAAETFAVNPNANALRFATLFNFWFDADSAEPISHTLTLFKPGSPTDVIFWPGDTLFIDGFELNDTSAWSVTVP